MPAPICIIYCPQKEKESPRYTIPRSKGQGSGRSGDSSSLNIARVLICLIHGDLAPPAATAAEPRPPYVGGQSGRGVRHSLICSRTRCWRIYYGVSKNNLCLRPTTSTSYLCFSYENSRNDRNATIGLLWKEQDNKCEKAPQSRRHRASSRYCHGRCHQPARKLTLLFVCPTAFHVFVLLTLGSRSKSFLGRTLIEDIKRGMLCQIFFFFFPRKKSKHWGAWRS